MMINKQNMIFFLTVLTSSAADCAFGLYLDLTGVVVTIGVPLDYTTVYSYIKQVKFLH